MKTPKDLQDAVKNYQNGEKDCFDQLYELSYPYLYTCMIHVVKDEEAAMDMLQETYLEISRSITQLKNTEDFLSWASKIGNRKCYAFLKKQKDVLVSADNQGEGQDFFESIPDDEEFIPEAILQNQEKQRLIKEMIDSLSDMQRLCVIGFYYREQTLEEISQELEIPVNTVKSHLNRSRTKIRDAVIALDKEKGTRLYSIAPFMLLLLSNEAEACEAAPLSEPLKKELAESGFENKSTVPKGGMKTAAYKIAAGALLAAVVIGGSAALVHLSSSSSGAGVESETGLAEDAQQSGEAAPDAAKNTEIQIEMEQQEEKVQTEAEETDVSETETEQTLLAESITLSFDLDEYESFGNACGGVIPVKKDGLWGAVDYNKEEIVPCSYSGFWKMPNLSGYFVLTENTGYETVYILFASDGTKVYEGTDEVTASGNFYAVRSETSYNNPDCDWEGTTDYYDYNGNKILSTTYLEGGSALSPIIGAYDGKTAIRRQSYKTSGNSDIIMEGGTLCEDGTVVWDSKIYQEDVSDIDKMHVFQYPIGLPNHGYTIENNMALEGGALSVYTEGYQQALWLNLSCMSYNGSQFVKGYNDMFDWGYFVYDGARVANYGSKMVWIIDNQYILVDLALADSCDEDGYIGADIIQAVYDDIVLSMEPYWLVQKGQQWGYIDHDGNEQAMYEDASGFANGYALVIEAGQAYVINENFEKVEECGAADRVASYGEFLGREENNVLYLIKR